MTLVEIRCKTRGCGRLLGTVDRAPEDWSGFLVVPACPDHGWNVTGPIGGVRRAFGEPMGDLPPVAERSVQVRYASLRPAIEEAWRTSRRQVHAV